MDREKVAIICPTGYPVPAVRGGAVETLIDGFLKENEKEGRFDITVYSYFDKEAEEKSKIYKNTKFNYLKVNKIYNKIFWTYLKLMKKIFNKNIDTLFITRAIKDINKNNIKKVIVEAQPKYVVPIKTKVKGVEVFYHIHHDAFWDKNVDKRDLKRIAECCEVVTISNYITKRTLSSGYILPSKIHTLLNCTDVNKFNKEIYIKDREDLRNKYNIKEDEILILFSGRLLEIKGVRELILAFKKCSKNLKAKLLIVGNAGFGIDNKSDYDKELEILANDIKEKVIFTGYIHNSQMPKIHAMCDIAVVPSIWEEPAGLVVIEAMSSGLPVIVTDAGGITEFADEKSSIIIKRDENLIDELSNALEKLILDKELRKSMGENARKRALQFSYKKYYDDFSSIIDEHKGE